MERGRLDSAILRIGLLIRYVTTLPRWRWASSETVDAAFWWLEPDDFEDDQEAGSGVE